MSFISLSSNFKRSPFIAPRLVLQSNGMVQIFWILAIGQRPAASRNVAASAVLPRLARRADTAAWHAETPPAKPQAPPQPALGAGLSTRLQRPRCADHLFRETGFRTDSAYRAGA